MTAHPVCIPDKADGMVGVGGIYHLYVTAEKPGEYEFTAYESLPQAVSRQDVSLNLLHS